MQESTQRESHQNDTFQQTRGTQTAHQAYTAYGKPWKSTSPSISDSSELFNRHFTPHYDFQEQHYQPDAMFPDDGHADDKMPEAERQQTLAYIASIYERRFHHTTKVRYDESVRRLDAHYHWDSVQQDVRHLRESADRLMAKASGNKMESSTKKPKASLVKLRARMQSDLEAIGNTMQSVDKLMKDLMDGDRRIGKAEKALDNATRAIVAAAQKERLGKGHFVSAEVLLTPTSPTHSEHSLDTGPAMAPQLINFYNAVANFKIMRERVGDLHLERQEQWERRALQEDQDQVLDQSDEQFFASWESTLKGPAKDLQDAYDSLQGARRACAEADVLMPVLEELEVPEVFTINTRTALTQLATVSPPNTVPYHQPDDQSQQQFELVRLGPEMQGWHEVVPASTGPMHSSNESSPPAPVSLDHSADTRVARWIEKLEPMSLSEEQAPIPSPDSPTSAPDTQNSPEQQHNPVLRAIRSLSALFISTPATEDETSRARASSFPQTPQLGMQKQSISTDRSPPVLQKPP